MAKCVLAVSGGSDSMAMLRLFIELYGRDSIVVAHLDHGIRETSDRDCRFVQRACENLGVPCCSDRRPVLELRCKGESVEEAARRVRYDFLEEVRAAHQARWIALGHTRDDLAETVLLNLARGCGLWGLAGMPEIRDPFIRPVLDFSREELRDILREAQWAWVDDETNSSDIYLRNRVRLEVMPLMSQRMNPRIVEHLAALAGEVAQWRCEEERSAQLDWARLKRPVPWPWIGLDLSGLRRMESSGVVRLLRHCARKAGLTSLERQRWHCLEALIRRSGRWTFQWGSFVDIVARDGLVILGPAAEKLNPEMSLRAGEILRWGGWEIRLSPCSQKASAPWSLWGPRVEKIRLIRRQSLKGDWFADRLPRLFWGEFPIDPKITGWENSSDSVEWESILRLDMRPLCGHWRIDDGI